MTLTRILPLGLAAALTATFAVAQSNDMIEGAIKARKAHMSLYGANLGVLGGMAQDQIPYDAELAAAAAGNLAALAGLDERLYWPEGSAAGTVEGTRALAAIWENPDDFAAQQEALLQAALALETAAGDGIDALKAAFGPVGGACGACHRAYREPN